MKLAELFNKENEEQYVGFGDNLTSLKEALKGPFHLCPKGLSREEFRKWAKETEQKD